MLVITHTLIMIAVGILVAVISRDIVINIKKAAFGEGGLGEQTAMGESCYIKRL